MVSGTQSEHSTNTPSRQYHSHASMNRLQPPASHGDIRHPRFLIHFPLTPPPHAQATEA